MTQQPRTQGSRRSKHSSDQQAQQQAASTAASSKHSSKQRLAAVGGTKRQSGLERQTSPKKTCLSDQSPTAVRQNSDGIPTTVRQRDGPAGRLRVGAFVRPDGWVGCVVCCAACWGACAACVRLSCAACVRLSCAACVRLSPTSASAAAAFASAASASMCTATLSACSGRSVGSLLLFARPPPPAATRLVGPTSTRLALASARLPPGAASPRTRCRAASAEKLDSRAPAFLDRAINHASCR